MLESWNIVQNSFKARLCSTGEWSNDYTTVYTSIAIVGAMITSLGSGFLMKYGKQRLLLITNFVLIVGNCLT